MRIALTYDLRDDYLEAGYSEQETAEFDRADTIDAIDGALRELGHRTVRIGRFESLVDRVSRGEGHRTDPWDLVFNICEGLRGIGREAQTPCLLDAFGIPYTFSDPLVCALTLHKGHCKRVVRDLGFRTARFVEAADERDLEACRALRAPLFAKPLAEGTSKGVTAESRIGSHAELAERCRALWREYHQPVLVEEYLPGREVTVGIVGTGSSASVAGVLEVVLRAGAEAGVYSYHNKEDCENLVTYSIASDAASDEAAHMALAIHRALGVRDAGRVDLRQDADGRMSFIEVNPLPGMHPEHSDLPILWSLGGGGRRYVDLIDSIVRSAAQRVPRRADATGRAT